MPTTRILYDLVARDNASRAFDKAGASASRTEKTITRASKAIVLAGAATAAAVVAIGYESVKAATEFQASMTKIQTQAGGTSKDVKVLSKDILDLGGKVQQGPQQLADAMYHLKSVGLDNAKAMKALKAASDLAAVGGANLEETTNAVAGAWRSGIKGAQSFGQSAATVNAIIGAGNMRMEDFIGAIGTGILPSAKSFGVSMKSVGAALALMTDEGIPADAAATRLRMTLSLLGAPSAVAEKQLNSIGLTGLKLANAMRGPQGIIGAIGLLKSHLDASGLSASRQAQLLSHAFGGGRSSSAILTLINNFEVLKRKQDQINKSVSKFGPAVAAQKKTAEAQLHFLESNLETMGIKIGSALVGPLAKMAGFLNRVLLPAVITVTGQIVKLFKRIIPVDAIKRDWHELMAFFGANKPKPSKAQLSPFTGTGTTSVLAPRANVTTNMGGMPAKAVTAPAANMAANLGKALQNVNWGSVLMGVITKVGSAFGSLLSKIDWVALGKTAAFAAVPFIISFVNNLSGALISEAIHHPMDLALFIVSLIPIGRGAAILEKVFGEIPLLGPLIKMFTKPLAAAGKVTEKFFGKILKLIFGKTADRIAGFFGGVKDWLVGKGQDLLVGLARGAGIGFRAVTRFLGKIFGWVLRPFAKALTWLLSKGSDVVGGLLSGMTRKLVGLLAWVGKIGGKILALFAKAGSWLLQAGGHLIEGMLGGIRQKMLGIGGWVKGNIVDPVINAVKGFFGIHSPSTVMHGIGFNLVEGLVRGVIHADPVSAVTSIFGSMPKALGSIVGKGLISIESLPGKAMSALGKLGGFFGGIFGKLFGGGGGAGVQKWVPLVLKVLGMLHQPASVLPIVMSQMMTESGGNPNAINLTDSNAKAGIPSQGLMQVIPPTFAAYAGPFLGLGIRNPLANIYAGLNYAIHRYGSGWTSVLGHGHGYAKGTTGAKPGWAWVGEEGPELVKFGGGEDVLDSKTSKAMAGYAKGTDLAKLGRRLLRQRHHGVLNWEIVNTANRKHQENLLANAPGTSRAQRRHFAAEARHDKARLANLKHTLRAEVAYRKQLRDRIDVLKATVKAAKHAGLGGEARQLGHRQWVDEQIVDHINLWVHGHKKPKGGEPKGKTKPKKVLPPTGNMDISDWATYLSALSGGTLPAFATGSMYVPATGPAIVHRGEMILPADVADAIRSGAGSGGGNFTGNLYLSSGELLGVIDGRIERSDRSHNRRVKSGSGRH